MELLGGLLVTQPPPKRPQRPGQSIINLGKSPGDHSTFGKSLGPLWRFLTAKGSSSSNARIESTIARGGERKKKQLYIVREK